MDSPSNKGSLPDSEYVTFLRAKGAKEGTIGQLIKTEYNSIETLQYMEHNAVESLSLSKPQTRLVLKIISDIQFEGMKQSQKSHPPKTTMATSQASTTKRTTLQAKTKMSTSQAFETIKETLPDTEFVTMLRNKGLKDDSIQKLIEADYVSVETLLMIEQNDVEELCLSKPQSRLLFSIVLSLGREAVTGLEASGKSRTTISTFQASNAIMEACQDREFVTMLRNKGMKDDNIQKLIEADYDSMETLRMIEQHDVEELRLSKPQCRLLLSIVTNMENEEGTGTLETGHSEATTISSQAGATTIKTLPDTEFVMMLRNKGLKDDTIQKLIEADYDTIETLRMIEQNDVEELCLSKPQSRLVLSIVTNMESEEGTGSRKAGQSATTMTTSQAGDTEMKTLPDTEFVTLLRKKGIKDDNIQILIEADYDSMETLRMVERNDVDELGLSKPQSRLVLSIVSNLESKEGTGTLETSQYQTTMAISQASDTRMEILPDTEFVMVLRNNGMKENNIQKLIEADYDSMETLRMIEQNDVEELCLSKPQTRLLLSIVTNMKSGEGTGSSDSAKTKMATSKASDSNMETLPACQPQEVSQMYPEFASFLRDKEVKEATINKLIAEEYDSIKTLQLMKTSHLESLQLSQPQTSLVLSIVEELKGGVESVESREASYDDDYKQGLREFGLDEDTILRITSNGFTNLEVLVHLGKVDLDFMKLSDGQRAILEKVVAEMNKTDIVESNNSQGTTMQASGTLPKSSKQKRKIPTQFEKLERYGIQKTGFGQFYNYLEEMDALDVPLNEKYKNGLKVIKLPVKQDYADRKGKVRRCIIGSPKKKHEQKTIMIVGATGAGKSTLVDGLINYVFDTKWTDKHRIRLIDQHAEEAENESKGQSQSQTEWITIYTITFGNSNNIQFTLNLIDTPGFGDTRGITRDQMLINQIRALFSSQDNHGLDSIDAICFVAKAPDARLTASQKYIFNSVLSVFGKDIAENIIVMITFADGQRPAVLDAIKAAELPHRQHFSFNNSALYADNGAAGIFSKNFWDMSFDSFQRFFSFLVTLTPKSLTMTQDVLEKRSDLKDTLQYLQDKLQEGLNIKSTLQKEKDILVKHKEDIEANKNFELIIEEPYMEKVSLGSGKFSNYCTSCKNTCHRECTPSKYKYFCQVFTWGGSCKRCSGKCSVGKHEKVTYRYEPRMRKVNTTCEEKKKKYQEVTGNRDKQLSIIQLNELAYEKYQKEFEENMEKCAEVLKQLDEIALKPDPMSEVEYVEELIETQRSEHKTGWEDRVKELRKFKDQAQRVKEIRSHKRRK